jgi:hypothetical protein
MSIHTYAVAAPISSALDAETAGQDFYNVKSKALSKAEAGEVFNITLTSGNEPYRITLVRNGWLKSLFFGDFSRSSVNVSTEALHLTLKKTFWENIKALKVRYEKQNENDKRPAFQDKCSSDEYSRGLPREHAHTRAEKMLFAFELGCLKKYKEEKYAQKSLLAN